MANPDVRWHQRFQNFVMALSQLEMAGQLAQTRQLSELEKQGLIQVFEFTHELAWNVLKDYFEYQGNPSITGSRDASREAFQNGLVSKGEVWMEMIKSRNKTSHTYNRKIADEIVEKILTEYISAFGEFNDKMNVYDR
ncbi:MAG: nucleotidyltransferase substrate binding protein [Bdellovibrionales bacterium]|nr:nucleotidyltransferase substrate binding protein [Bdellovibrionales bacterium]